MIPKKRMSLNKKSLTHTPSTAWCLVKYMFKHFSAFVIIISGLQKYDMRASKLHQLHTTWNTLPPHCISATANKRRRRNRTQSESNKHLSNNHRISTILASAINTTPMHHWRSYYHLQTMMGIIIEWQTVLWYICVVLCADWSSNERRHLGATRWTTSPIFSRTWVCRRRYRHRPGPPPRHLGRHSSPCLPLRRLRVWSIKANL